MNSCPWWSSPVSPRGGGDFWLFESHNLWSYNSSAELPSFAGPQETHTHMHACVHSIFFLCYTFISFPLSTCMHPARPSSFMRFPDVDRFRPLVCVPSWLMLLLYNIRLPLCEPRDTLWSWAWPPTSLKVKAGEHGVYCRLQVSGTGLQMVYANLDESQFKMNLLLFTYSGALHHIKQSNMGCTKCQLGNSTFKI